MFGFGEAMVRTADHMDFLRQVEVAKDPIGLFDWNEFILFSVDDQTVGNPRQKRKQQKNTLPQRKKAILRK